VLATQNIKVASEDGQEAWVFSPAGRHLQTIDVLTNSMLLTFVYDAAGRLSPSLMSTATSPPSSGTAPASRWPSSVPSVRRIR
jgi:hypothetical protein